MMVAVLPFKVIACVVGMQGAGMSLDLGTSDLVDVSATQCAGIVGATPMQLYSTPDVYDVLRALDAAECPGLSEDAFEQITLQTELNMVSYALLEERLVPAAPALSPQLIAGYVDDYEQAQGGLDANLVLSLIDMAYYPCAGDEACVAEQLQGWIGGRVLSDPAQCLFGLEGTCAAEDVPVPLVNAATLTAAEDTEALTQARDAFVCGRYLDCKDKGD